MPVLLFKRYNLDGIIEMNNSNTNQKYNMVEKGVIKMGNRKTRSDCTVGTFEKKSGLPAGTIRNKDGRDTRSDKLIGTIRKEAEKKK